MNMHTAITCEEVFQGYRITDLGLRQCRFPITGDTVRGTDHRFCGEPVVRVRRARSVFPSYCLEHFKRVAAPHLVREMEAQS